MKLLKRILVAILVSVTLLCSASMFTNTVNAASTKKVSSSYTASKVSQTKNYKKIPEIKTGKTIVTMKKQHSYVKFTAKKEKTYKLTFTDVKKPSTKNVNGYLTISKIKTTGHTTYLDAKNVKTEGGKTKTLQISNKSFLNSWKTWNKDVSKKEAYRTTRTAKIKLKKGESIFIEGYFAGGSKEKTTYTVTIK